ncbi:Elongation factor 1-delta [Plecturocebus cupreus]
MRQVELPPPQKPSTLAEDDEDNDTDLFGSGNKEKDKEAARLQEEQLQQHGPAGGTCALHPDGLAGERGLQGDARCLRYLEAADSGCVVADHKVGTDLLEEISKFEEHVQSVNIAAFNKI